MPTMTFEQMRDKGLKDGGFEPLTPGTYNARVKTAEVKKGKNYLQILTRLEIMDGPLKDKTILNNMAPMKNDGDPNGIFFQQIGVLGFGKEHPVWAQMGTLELEQALPMLASVMVGAMAIIEVTNDDKWDDILRDNVKKMKPYGSAVVTGPIAVGIGVPAAVGIPPVATATAPVVPAVTAPALPPVQAVVATQPVAVQPVATVPPPLAPPVPPASFEQDVANAAVAVVAAAATTPPVTPPEQEVVELPPGAPDEAAAAVAAAAVAAAAAAAIPIPAVEGSPPPQSEEAVVAQLPVPAVPVVPSLPQPPQGAPF